MGLYRIVFTVLSLRPSTGKIRLPQAVRPSRCAARSELAMIGAVPALFRGAYAAAIWPQVISRQDQYACGSPCHNSYHNPYHNSCHDA